ncbi:MULTISPECIES: gliding motility protein GldN [Muribaculum]|mgnify:FL=1|jgi:gliding motility associated protien GldN|uniref:Gliding motility protein GldN n=1 Tax=Muribaculum caecicola TaxID=3038144 RepID=A0AC61S3S6_9BACT|nr:MULTISPECIES: gliding motility protein GldN [Muribaculum]THG43828.1 gliding motility protein GldN [Muribaculum caecicola]
MNAFRYITVLAAATLLTVTATAQTDRTESRSSSSSVVRKGSKADRNANKTAGATVTDRMQKFFEEPARSDADAQWMKIVYRQLDLENVKNAPLYYPEEAIEGQENLFRIIMKLLANGNVKAYEYLDGREIFTDQYQVKVADMLDRFHILYTPAKGSTEKNPKFTIEESDVPTNEVLSYYLLERWELDKRANRMRTTVDAICPVLHRSGDFGGEAVKYPMFWIKMDALRPYLTQQSIFIDDDNNLAQYNYDDYFQLALYEGDIYKTRNLRNRSMMQLYPDPDDMKKAQDSIQNYLVNYEKKMWVPSREELAAAREAKEKAELGDTIAERQIKESTPKRSSRAKRATRTKEPKVKQSKVKQAKVKSNSSSSATRSVRRRR